MAKYMSFDFSDGECNHCPIVVRIEQDISFDTMKEIDKATNDKMNKYISKGDYWDTDEILVDNVLKKMSKKYNFNYEIVGIDYNVDCN